MPTRVVSFLNNYPLLPVLQISVNTLLIFIALFLLRVLYNTHLHINCRFLFTIWLIGFLLVFLSHAFFGILNFSQDDGYLPENMIEPAPRNYLYKLEMTSIFFTTCVEVLITTERVVSSINPEVYYYRNQLAKRILIPLMVLAIIFSLIAGNITSGGHFIVTGMVSFSLDVTTLSINSFAVRYCRKRDLELHGNCSLNARYQVKESSDMASTMQPALLISIFMKNTVNTIFLLFCVVIDDVSHKCTPFLFETHWGILETLYSMNMSLNGGFLMLWLLHNHPRLRRNSERLRYRLRGNDSKRGSSIVKVELKSNEGTVYFDELKKLWTFQVHLQHYYPHIIAMASTIFLFLNKFPILAISQTLGNTIAVLCCLFVFRVIHSTQLHANCRFLFMLWSLGYSAIYVCQLSISIMSFFGAHGYLAESTFDPPARVHVYRIQTVAIMVTASMEIMIAIERIISAIQPEKYYEANRLAKGCIFTILSLFLIASGLIAYESVGDSFVLIGCIISLLDLLTILVNTVAMKYCRRRDSQLLGKCSLNARYQASKFDQYKDNSFFFKVKESADMASAMQPALIVAFLMKCSGSSVFIWMCFNAESTDCASLLLTINWGIMEAFFMADSVISGVLLNVWIVLKNPRLRRNAEKLLGRWGITLSRGGSSRVVKVELKKNEGKIYFDSLRQSWM